MAKKSKDEILAEALDRNTAALLTIAIEIVAIGSGRHATGQLPPDGVKIVQDHFEAELSKLRQAKAGS